jgi:hypothetical protein
MAGAGHHPASRLPHYGYLVLKMSSPNDIIKIHRDHTAIAFAPEKLQALAVAQEAIAGFDELDPAPSSSRQRISSSTPNMQPSDNEDIPVNAI